MYIVQCNACTVHNVYLLTLCLFGGVIHTNTAMQRYFD